MDRVQSVGDWASWILVRTLAIVPLPNCTGHQLRQVAWSTRGAAGHPRLCQALFRLHALFQPLPGDGRTEQYLESEHERRCGDLVVDSTQRSQSTIGGRLNGRSSISKDSISIAGGVWALPPNNNTARRIYAIGRWWFALAQRRSTLLPAPRLFVLQLEPVWCGRRERFARDADQRVQLKAENIQQHGLLFGSLRNGREIGHSTLCHMHADHCHCREIVPPARLSEKGLHARFSWENVEIF